MTNAIVSMKFSCQERLKNKVKTVYSDTHLLSDIIFYLWSICGRGIYGMPFQNFAILFFEHKPLWNITVIYVRRDHKIFKKSMHDKELAKC